MDMGKGRKEKKRGIVREDNEGRGKIMREDNELSL